MNEGVCCRIGVGRAGRARGVGWGVPLAVWLCCTSALAAQTPEVFGAGSITIEGESVYRGTYHPDGRSFWFFRKLAEGRDEYRIWTTHATPDGWAPAERVHLGGEHSDLYPTFSPDGRVMVITSYRRTPSGGPPQANLWAVPVHDDGTFGHPEFMAEHSVEQAYDAAPRFDADGWLIWTSTTYGPGGERRHRRARWTGEGFTPPEPDPSIDPWREWRDDLFVWEVLPSPDGQWRLLSVSHVGADGRRAPTDVWISRRDGSGWSEPSPLGPAVNTPDYETFLGFSPDSRALLFVRDFSTYYRLSIGALAEIGR